MQSICGYCMLGIIWKSWECARDV